MLVHHHHRVGSCFQQFAVAALALRQLFGLNRKTAALELYFRSVADCSLSLSNPQMDECRESEQACNEQAAVYPSDPGTEVLDPIDSWKPCCSGEDAGNECCAPEQPLG